MGSSYPPHIAAILSLYKQHLGTALRSPQLSKKFNFAIVWGGITEMRKKIFKQRGYDFHTLVSETDDLWRGYGTLPAPKSSKKVLRELMTQMPICPVDA